MTPAERERIRAAAHAAAAAAPAPALSPAQRDRITAIMAPAMRKVLAAREGR